MPYQGFDIMLLTFVILVLILLLYQLSYSGIRSYSSEDSFIYIELKKRFVAQPDSLELYIISRIIILLSLLFNQSLIVDL